MASGLINIGVSGLLAYQRSLDAISHNIANVNTEGYSRQSVNLTARPPQITGYGFVGKGVEIASIQRSFDAYVEGNLRSSTSSTSEFEAFHTLASQLDNVMADADAGMSTSLQRFFNAMQDVADTPADPVARAVVMNEAQQLAEQFNGLAGWVENLRGHVNSDLRASVNEINGITSSIAQLNESIVVEQGRSGGKPANDLLDQRDALILRLSEYVNVTTLQQDDGAINVLVGSGQPLVVGNRPSSLAVFNEPGDPNALGIALTNSNGSLTPVTKQLTGGRMGGVLGFRDNMLDQASNSLGLVAIGMADFVNQQHARGMDIDGALGGDFFSVAQPQVISITGAPGNVSIGFDDVAQLTNQDYELQFNTGVWSLSRNDTGQVIPMTGSGTAIDPFVADGLSIVINVPPAAGDTYEIRPTRNGARDIDLALGSSRQIATAAPIRSQAENSNTGSGSISAGSVSDITNPAFQATPGQLTPPLMLRFTAANTYDVYDNTNPAAPVLLEAGIAYNPATGGDIFPTPGGIDDGYRMRLTGAPAAGDEFSTEFNTGGSGDNRNALAIGALATSKLMSGGTASITDSYNSLVADVGTGTRQAEQNRLAHKGVLERVNASHDAISGVNLDEEAANLVRFQQAYQAAAQVISTANSLFDTLLNAVRR
jgi:flagellar hook-associated protein 1 FlgK